jgi:MBG domain
MPPKKQNIRSGKERSNTKAEVSLSKLSHNYDSRRKEATATTNPADLKVVFAYYRREIDQALEDLLTVETVTGR